MQLNMYMCVCVCTLFWLVWVRVCICFDCPLIPAIKHHQQAPASSVRTSNQAHQQQPTGAISDNRATEILFKFYKFVLCWLQLAIWPPPKQWVRVRYKNCAPWRLGGMGGGKLFTCSSLQWKRISVSFIYVRKSFMIFSCYCQSYCI